MHQKQIGGFGVLCLYLLAVSLESAIINSSRLAQYRRFSKIQHICADKPSRSPLESACLYHSDLTQKAFAFYKKL
jgi:hypothetical protein